jgi:hypothetical protein
MTLQGHKLTQLLDYSLLVNKTIATEFLAGECR